MQLGRDLIQKINNAVLQLSDLKKSGCACYDNSLGSMPSIKKLSAIVKMTREIIFPGYFEDTNIRLDMLQHYMGVYVEDLFRLLTEQIFAGLCFSCEKFEKTDKQEQKQRSREIAVSFVSFLPELRRMLNNDVEATFLGDPAAQNRDEVIFCYPAIRAISNYRIAHQLVKLGVPIIPRIISEMAHSETGIDINPEAQIGEYFTIDHGTGVVIGSTCIIGNNVKLYQGVTLGAKSFPLDEKGNPIKGIPRHPIVEDNVIIYAQATILGRIRIGENSIIGGNVWVTNDIPPNSKVMQFKMGNSAGI